MHIFLFNHYENKKYGYHPKSAAELQAIVDRLDPKLVTIKGASGWCLRVWCLLVLVSGVLAAS